MGVFFGVGLGTRRFGSGMGHGILMGGMDLDLDMGIFSGVGVCFAVGGGGGGWGEEHGVELSSHNWGWVGRMHVHCYEGINDEYS